MGPVAAAIAIALAGMTWLIDPPAETGRAEFRDGLDLASLHVLEHHSTGQPLVWRNAASGFEAVITPASAFRDHTGRLCRPYSIERTGGDHTRQIACRHPNGMWDPAVSTQVAGNMP